MNPALYKSQYSIESSLGRAFEVREWVYLSGFFHPYSYLHTEAAIGSPASPEQIMGHVSKIGRGGG